MAFIFVLWVINPIMNIFPFITSSLKAEDLSANQAELKAKIVEVASRYTGQVFLKEEARSKLEPLINELVASVDPRNEEEKLAQVIGG